MSLTPQYFAIFVWRSLFYAVSLAGMEIFECWHDGISCIVVFAGMKKLLSH
jgi:hypothetical protein